MTDYRALLEQAFLTIEALQAELAQRPPLASEPIAVVGLGCRFPGGANSPQTLWQNLVGGVDAISEVPGSRWDVDTFYDPDLSSTDKMSTRWGGFIQGIEDFDPNFFGISRREVTAMDPQQRLVLEVAWEALEHAGINPEQVAGTATGVFIAVCSCDFYKLLLNAPTRSGTGILTSIIANRLSYFLDLKGPSMVVDTACSSSLVAVDLACQNLHNGTCNVALAGGVNVLLTPDLVVTSSQAGLMAADGRCKTFDHRADGYVRGEGCGVVVLKRLRDAQRDGDTVMGLIRGSAINQDGRSTGLTAPNSFAQRDLIRQALSRSGVQADAVDYIEAHGTGTSLGDPIEVEALTQVYGQPRPQQQPCYLGSIKTNIGHLEAAAGIAGLIKVVLSLHHEHIPPHLHFTQLNSNINFAHTPFAIPITPRPWSRNATPRYAAVSSFGVGGTNAHVILEEAPQIPKRPGQLERPRHLLMLSAQTETALMALAKRFQQHISTQQDQSLANICYTANIGRARLPHQLLVSAATPTELQENLQKFYQGESFSGQVRRRSTERLQIAFLFTGQSSQYADMGRVLYQTQPSFRQNVDHCAALLDKYLEQPLLTVLFPATGTSSSIDETAYAQPALFTLEYALAQLWRSWGVVPAAVLGHSVGEYVAACVAEVFSLEDGIKLIASRARLMQQLPQQGTMALIQADETYVQQALAGYHNRVTIAAINGPHSTVIAGETNAVEEVLNRCEEDFLFTKLLKVSHAFHSPLMTPMLEEFEKVLQTVNFKPPTLPLVSNVSGQIFAQGQIPDAHYWLKHVREPVHFQAQMLTLARLGFDTFLEIGPHSILTKQGQQCLPKKTATWLHSLNREQDNWFTLIQAFTGLWERGLDLNGRAFDQDYPRRKVHLPTYPFERLRCWLEPSEIRSYPQEVERPCL